MSNEATIRAGLAIKKGNLNYKSAVDNFRADVAVGKGPSPGAFTATLAGVAIDLSNLANPSLALIKNLDTTNYVIVGLSDGTEFYPLFDILPGEQYPCRFSQHLGESHDVAGVGTGTYDTGTYQPWIKATVAECEVVVEAFEK